MSEAIEIVESPAARLIALLGWRAIAAACISKQTGAPISKQAVYKWAKLEIPPEHVLTLERLSVEAGGTDDRFSMRPDLHGDRPAGWVSPFTAPHAPRRQEGAYVPG